LTHTRIDAIDAAVAKQLSLFRFIAHLFKEASGFTESTIDPQIESNFNSVKSCVAGTVAAQDETRADVIELNVRLMEEKDGRENME
jgi:hypothetical protein